MKIIDIKESPLSYLRTFVIEYIDTSGTTRKWEMVSRKGLDRIKSEHQGYNHSDGSMIVAWDESKEHVVMVKEFRVIAGKYIYSFPAGLQDEGETIEETSIREFKEETGLDFTYLGQDGPRYTSVGLSNEKVHTVFGTFRGTMSIDFKESSEDITPLIVDKKEAQRILKEEEVTIRSAFILMNLFQIPMYETL